MAMATAVVVYFLTRITKAILLKQLNRTGENGNAWRGIALAVIGRVKAFFLLVAALYAGSLVLALPDTSAGIIESIFFISLLVQIGLIANQIIRTSFEQYRLKTLEKNAEAVTMLGSVSFLSRVLVWLIVLLVALDNFGVNITALVAGLGVGGVAVALAVQNILGDVFASFSIVLDKPFVIGDFIIVDDLLGTVEYVGLKTTRIRSLSGEQLIFSNNDLLSSRIRNFKRMYERRVVFSIGVVYQTPPDKLEKIPGMIRSLIEAQDKIRFDRAHFKAYGPYSLDFEVVYWVLNPDYAVYMDIQQAINLGIYKAFEAEGIEFAYPTQTLMIPRPAETGTTGVG
ncbi:MAG: mechanosensitive ion channel family protein [Desulfatitalea sp.]|nr:mechanosensitive ion channel family protein [Desulfatitalea sp.]